MNFQITELDSGNSAAIDESLKLLNRTQGQGLFGLEYLSDKAHSKEAVVFTGSVEGRLISTGCAEIIVDFDYYKPFDSRISERIGGKKVGSLCTLSVHDDYQGQGLGQKMTRRRMNWLEARECDLVLGVSWVSGLSHTSNRVFEKSGFRAVREVQGFYREAAISHPFACPGCRTQPCECSAILYDYHFNREES